MPIGQLLASSMAIHNTQREALHVSRRLHGSLQGRISHQGALAWQLAALLHPQQPVYNPLATRLQYISLEYHDAAY